MGIFVKYEMAGIHLRVCGLVSFKAENLRKLRRPPLTIPFISGSTPPAVKMFLIIVSKTVPLLLVAASTSSNTKPTTCLLYRGL